MEKGNTLDVIRQCFASILNKSDAREKVPSLEFVTTLIFCFIGDSKIMSLESMRRWMIGELKLNLSKSSFWERLSRLRLKNLLHLLLAELMTKLVGTCTRGQDIINLLGVTKILLIDSSSITLWDGRLSRY